VVAVSGVVAVCCVVPVGRMLAMAGMSRMVVLGVVVTRMLVGRGTVPGVVIHRGSVVLVLVVVHGCPPRLLLNSNTFTNSAMARSC
jgi:hypothetical protein